MAEFLALNLRMPEHILIIFITGCFMLQPISTDLYLHDTMFVVGHFHFTMAAGSVLGAFTGLYFWFPKLYGKSLDERLGKLHFWFTTLGLSAVFGGQLLVGWAGQQRRLFDPYQYTFIQGLHPLNTWTSIAAFTLFAGQLFFVWNFFKTLFFTKATGDRNPWGVPTLEWTDAASPPAYHNFDRIPHVVRGPHHLSDPAVTKALGRDFLGQAEPAPAGASEA